MATSRIMKGSMKITCLVLVAALLLPIPALAQQYPRTVRIGEMDCMERSSRAGIETWCRVGSEPPFQVDPATGLRVEQVEPDPPDLRLAKGSQLPLANPVVRATNMAAQQGGTGGHFAGGFGLGVLLGPIGWVIAGLQASNSSVTIPGPAPGWTPEQQTQFALTYASEVRSSRTSAAIMGGVTGSLVLGAIVLLVVSGQD